MISQDKIEEVKQSNDIVDIIGERLTLKKAGRNFKGLCPLHGEKTPSYIVSPDKQIYHCFGCGAGGNVFSFIQNLDKLNFIESVKFLAQRAHIVIEEAKPGSVSDIKDKLKHISAETLKFFVENLAKNETAKTYLKERGITEEIITEFKLGYSPDSYHALLDHLKAKFTDTELFVKAGVCQFGDHGQYDTFRNRIMFPILNIFGEVIAFGGRVMDSSLPKYINSKETDIYIKGRNLYNLNNARKHVEEALIITEGYMDTIAMSAAGFKNTAASLGTSLTEEQAGLIKRYSQKVYMMYDMDEAGMNASIRAGEMLIKEGLEVFIVTYPEAKDPDDFIKKNGVEKMRDRISAAVQFVEFKIDHMLEKGDAKDPYFKEKIIKETLDILEKTGNLVAKADGIRRLAQKLSVPEDIISGYLKKDFRKSTKIDSIMSELDFLKQKGVLSAERLLLKTALKAFSREDEGVILRKMAAKRENFEISYAEFKNDIYAGILNKIEQYQKEAVSNILERIQMDYVENEEASKLIAGLIVEDSGRDLKDGETYEEKDAAQQEKKRSEEGKKAQREEESDDLLQIIEDCFGKLKDAKIKLMIDLFQEKIVEAEKNNDVEKLEAYIKEKQKWQKMLKQKEDQKA